MRRGDGAVEYHAIFDLVAALVRAPTLVSRLERICASAVGVLPCDRSSVFLRAGDRYHAFANHGNPPAIAEAFSSFSISRRDPLVASVLADGRSATVVDARDDPRIPPEFAEAVELQSLLMIMLLADADGGTGLVTFEHNQHSEPFGPDALEWAEGFARIHELCLLNRRPAT